jgi:23S rRNA (cytidine1920-2'-O)/16S rRNA (cytidine1409-2'-O)-methyltransferase
MDRTNLRHVTSLPESVDLATLDLSFISLRLVLATVRRLLTPQGRVIALVKPQFEAGRADVPRGGVVRDPAVHRRVLIRLAADARQAGFAARNLVASPRTGRQGNREFLVLLRATAPSDPESPHDEPRWGVLVDAALESRITI